MLLDFADVLQTSVYSLGGTFLRLVRLLNLEIPLIDPSFYVGRFAAKLEFGEKTQAVSNTALRLVARMKRDWIQTGRRPAGVCAAGLIIAARIHGFRRTDQEVVRVVRICEATLKKRLEEFAATPSGGLTPEQFEGVWLEQENDPPSFTKNKKRIETAGRMTSFTLNAPATTAANFVMTPFEAPDETTFSDLDDDEEVTDVLLEADEVAMKTRIWSALNKDYLREEAEKAKLEAVAQKYEEVQTDTTKEKAAAAGKKRGSRGPRQGSKAQKSAEPAETAAEAARQMMAAKKFSKKINYDALDSLFSASATSTAKR
jgi:transcription factor IIIB subunit 2